jgi:hypothetical protein
MSSRAYATWAAYESFAMFYGRATSGRGPRDSL